MRLLKAMAVPVLPVLAIATAGAEPYPDQCCPRYCAAMTEVKGILDDGNAVFVITRKYGRLTVPASVERRPSPDGRFHICAGFTDHAVEVKCIFVPAMV